jgi:hypothetical protein
MKEWRVTGSPLGPLNGDKWARSGCCARVERTAGNAVPRSKAASPPSTHKRTFGRTAFFA